MKTNQYRLQKLALTVALSLSAATGNLFADTWIGNGTQENANWSNAANWVSGTAPLPESVIGLDTTTSLNVGGTVTSHNDLAGISFSGIKFRGNTALHLTGNALYFSGYQWLLENVSQPITYVLDNDITFSQGIQLQLNQGGSNIGISPGISFSGKFINGVANGGSLQPGSWDTSKTRYTIDIKNLYLSSANATGAFAYTINGNSAEVIIDRIYNQTEDSTRTDNYGLNLSGDSTLTVRITGSADYRGNTSVRGGVTLIVGGTADITSSNLVQVWENASLFYNSSVTLEKFSWNNNGKLGGTGNILGSSAYFRDANQNYTLRPGDLDATGTLHFVGNDTAGSENVTWNNGASTLTYEWQFDGTGYDSVDIAGTLTLGATNTYILNIGYLGDADSAALAEFMAAAGGSLEVLKAAALTLNDATWSLTGDGSELLDLQITDSGLSLALIPEPSVWLLFAGGAALLVCLRRRR
ncbi:MAG: PEP-CTERM sorting domain-containing protein [Verrucomicrobiales bacterium]|jgi:hypothetical protein|nr:PEP-CTERM sorting domain-containing protein [Verrucomicrobiales bacterium]